MAYCNDERSPMLNGLIVVLSMPGIGYMERYKCIQFLLCGIFRAPESDYLWNIILLPIVYAASRRSHY